MRRIVVGFDGSQSAVAALRWAAAEAALSEAVVEAWTVIRSDGHDRGADGSELVLERFAHWVSGGAEVVHKMIEGIPAAELVRLAGDADLLVVGSHGHSAVPGLLLGSVSRGCLHTATGPVAVVRADQHARPPDSPVTVGVDGSPVSRLALVAAAEEARLRNTALHILHVVQPDRSGLGLRAPGIDDLLVQGRRLVEAEVSRASVPVPCSTFVLTGHPADVLTAASPRAALLVVGAHGTTGLAAQLGSVSGHCAAFSAAPTLVVR